MTINKFQGKTKEEAIEKAKAELGPNAVIMNIKELKPKGILQIFKSITYEVTAAMEEKDSYVNPMNSFLNKKHENISLSADEKIEIPKFTRTEERSQSATMKKVPDVKDERVFSQNQEKIQSENTDQIQKRLDHMSDELEGKLATDMEQEKKKPSSEELNFVRMLYSTLLQNEVNEKYINQILDEVEKFIRPGNSVDTILSNVYQKLILKFGQASTIKLTANKPHVVFFVGPTGVGKTTTIAKIASKYKVDFNTKVAFITADTYRIAATEQLRIYANILDAPMSIVYSAEELNESIEKFLDYDLIFVDTAGFSHKNQQQKEDTKNLITGADENYEKEIYLVLSATTKYKDLLDIVDIYRDIANFKLIFTKLDETSCYGNLLNIKLYSDAELSYVTNGQNVPDDLEVVDTQKIVKQLLGGR